MWIPKFQWVIPDRATAFDIVNYRTSTKSCSAVITKMGCRNFKGAGYIIIGHRGKGYSNEINTMSRPSMECESVCVITLKVIRKSAWDNKI